MSNLYIGTQRPKSIYIGTQKVKNIYLGTEKVWARLPLEYQEVEWIGSNNTQWILLTVQIPSGNATIKYETKNKYLNYKTSEISIEGNSYPCAWFGITTSGYYTIGGGITSTVKGSLTDYDTLTHTDSLASGTATSTLTINGATVITRTNPQTALLRGDTVGVFSAGGSGWAIAVQKKYFKVYINDVLTFDLVPCYRISDTEIGMYDLVNGVFYTNAGTGTFTKGPDV